jgi:hypothetical protein
MHFDAVEGNGCAEAQSHGEEFHRPDLAPSIRKRSRLSDHGQPAAQAQRRQRRFPRYRFDVRIQVSVFREGLTTEYWGRTNELGQDGIGATLSGELKSGEVVSLDFPIPLSPHIIKLRAVVRYCEGLRYGFEFLVVTDAQRQLMHQVCVTLANAS